MPNSDSTADIARPVICIVGPTASGKSDLAQLVAAAIGIDVMHIRRARWIFRRSDKYDAVGPDAEMPVAEPGNLIGSQFDIA